MAEHNPAGQQAHHIKDIAWSAIVAIRKSHSDADGMTRTDKERRSLVAPTVDQIVEQMADWCIERGVFDPRYLPRASDEMNSLFGLEDQFAVVGERAKIESMLCWNGGQGRHYEVRYLVALIEWNFGDSVGRAHVGSCDDEVWTRRKADLMAAAERTVGPANEMQFEIHWLIDELSKLATWRAAHRTLWPVSQALRAFAMMEELEQAYAWKKDGVPRFEVGEQFCPEHVNEAVDCYYAHRRMASIAWRLFNMIEGKAGWIPFSSGGLVRLLNRYVSPLVGNISNALTVIYIAAERYAIDDADEVLRAQRHEWLLQYVEPSHEGAIDPKPSRLECVITDVKNRTSIELAKEKMGLVSPTRKAKSDESAEDHRMHDDRLSPGEQVKILFGTDPDDPDGQHRQRLQLAGTVRNAALSAGLITQPEKRGPKGYFVLKTEMSTVAAIFGTMLRTQMSESKNDRKRAEEKAIKLFQELPSNLMSGRFLCYDCMPPHGFNPADPSKPVCPNDPTHTKFIPLKKTTPANKATLSSP